MRLAVIGAGPSGIFATQGVLDRIPGARVDVLDQGLSPFGLVRYGVAPDHQKIKSVTRVFIRTLGSPRVRFLGNVKVGDRADGADLDLDDLRRHYDGVIIATGAPRGRALEVGGADLPGSVTAAQIVPWYNGLPDARPPATGATSSAVVVGAGNVALDVARVLLKGEDGLSDTDAPVRVLSTLGTMGTTDVHVVSRRGPRDVKFGYPELSAIQKVPDVDIRFDDGDLAHLRRERDGDEPKTLQLLREWASRPEVSRRKRLHFHFGLQVKRLEGVGRVETVELAPTSYDNGERDRVRLSTGLVVAAIGYHADLPLAVPTDESTAMVIHDRGRVADRLYVVGWAKRGPQGVIGTNKVDALETVTTLAADLGTPAPGVHRPDVADVLQHRHVPYVRWEDWLRVDAHEVALGRAAGRERIKIDDRRALIEVLSPG